MENFNDNQNNIPDEIKNNNDDNTKQIFMERLFPFVNELKLQHKLKINKEAIMYISIPFDAYKITCIIIDHAKKLGLSNNNIRITDAMAGVGGNTISFANNFLHVNAVEINPEMYNYLSNNLDAYYIKNVSKYNNDYIELMYNLVNDIVFLDPPWGGKVYKNKKNIRLAVKEIPIEHICTNLLGHQSDIKQKNLILALKLPKNYDIEHLYSIVNANNDKKIYQYELKKMSIIIIESTYSSEI